MGGCFSDPNSRPVSSEPIVEQNVEVTVVDPVELQPASSNCTNVTVESVEESATPVSVKELAVMMQESETTHAVGNEHSAKSNDSPNEWVDNKIPVVQISSPSNKHFDGSKQYVVVNAPPAAAFTRGNRKPSSNISASSLEFVEVTDKVDDSALTRSYRFSNLGNLKLNLSPGLDPTSPSNVLIRSLSVKGNTPMTTTALFSLDLKTDESVPPPVTPGPTTPGVGSGHITPKSMKKKYPEDSSSVPITPKSIKKRYPDDDPPPPEHGYALISPPSPTGSQAPSLNAKKATIHDDYFTFRQNSSLNFEDWIDDVPQLLLERHVDQVRAFYNPIPAELDIKNIPLLNRPTAALGLSSVYRAPPNCESLSIADSFCWIASLSASQQSTVTSLLQCFYKRLLSSKLTNFERPLIVSLVGNMGAGKSVVSQATALHPQLSSIYQLVVSCTYPFVGQSELHFWNYVRMAFLTSADDEFEFSVATLLTPRGLFSNLEPEFFEFSSLSQAKKECSSYPFRISNGSLSSMCKHSAGLSADKSNFNVVPNPPIKILLLIDNARDDNIAKWCYNSLPAEYTVMITSRAPVTIIDEVTLCNVPSILVNDYIQKDILTSNFLEYSLPPFDNYESIKYLMGQSLDLVTQYPELSDCLSSDASFVSKVMDLGIYSSTGSFDEWQAVALCCNGSPYLASLLKSAIKCTLKLSSIITAITSAITPIENKNSDSIDDFVQLVKSHHSKFVEPRVDFIKSSIVSVLYDCCLNTLTPQQLLLLRFCVALSIYATVSGVLSCSSSLSFLGMCLAAHNQSVANSLTMSNSARSTPKRTSGLDDNQIGHPDRLKSYSLSSMGTYQLDNLFSDLRLLADSNLLIISLPMEHMLPSMDSVWKAMPGQENWISALFMREGNIFFSVPEYLHVKMRQELIMINILPVVFSSSVPSSPNAEVSLRPQNFKPTTLPSAGGRSYFHLNSNTFVANPVSSPTSQLLPPDLSIKPFFTIQQQKRSASSGDASCSASTTVTSMNINFAKLILSHLVSIFDQSYSFSYVQDSVFPSPRCLVPYLNFLKCMLYRHYESSKVNLERFVECIYKFRCILGLPTPVEIANASSSSTPSPSMTPNLMAVPSLDSSSRLSPLNVLSSKSKGTPSVVTSPFKRPSNDFIKPVVLQEVSKAIGYVPPAGYKRSESSASLFSVRKRLQSQASIQDLALFGNAVGFYAYYQRVVGAPTNFISEAAEELIWIGLRVAAPRAVGSALHAFFDGLTSHSSPLISFLSQQVSILNFAPGWLNLRKEHLSCAILAQHEFINRGSLPNAVTFYSRSLFLSFYSLIYELSPSKCFMLFKNGSNPPINSDLTCLYHDCLNFIDTLPNLQIAYTIFNIAVICHYNHCYEYAFVMYHLTILALLKSPPPADIAETSSIKSGSARRTPLSHILYGYVIHNLSILYLYSYSKFLKFSITILPVSLLKLSTFMPLPSVSTCCSSGFSPNSFISHEIPPEMLSCILSYLLSSLSHLDTLGGQHADLLQVCYNAGYICGHVSQFMKAPDSRHELVPPSSIDPYSQAKNAIASNALKTIELGQDAVDFLSLNRCWWFLIRHGGWFIDAAHQTAFVGLLQVVFRKKISHTLDSSALPSTEHSDAHQQLIEMLPDWLAILPAFEPTFLVKLFKFACEQGISSLVDLLFGYDKSVLNYRDADDKSGLMYAAWNGHGELVSIFCHHAPRLIHQLDVVGQSALHHACRQGHTDCVRILLSYGADPNAADKCNRTPLLLACQQSCTMVVLLLISCGALVNVCESKYLQTPLMVSARYNRLESLLLCLYEGAKVDSVDMHGRTAVHLAAKQGNTASCALLLAFEDTERAKLLPLPPKDSFTDSSLPTIVVDTLVALNNSYFDTNVIRERIQSQDSEGRTALSLACEYGHSETVELLLRIGSNATICDNNGKSPLSYAILNFHRNVTEILLESGIAPPEEDDPLHDVLAKILSNVQSSEQFTPGSGFKIYAPVSTTFSKIYGSDAFVNDPKIPGISPSIYGTSPAPYSKPFLLTSPPIASSYRRNSPSLFSSSDNLYNRSKFSEDKSSVSNLSLITADAVSNVQLVDSSVDQSISPKPILLSLPALASPTSDSQSQSAAILPPLPRVQTNSFSSRERRSITSRSKRRQTFLTADKGVKPDVTIAVDERLRRRNTTFGNEAAKEKTGVTRTQDGKRISHKSKNGSLDLSKISETTSLVNALDTVGTKTPFASPDTNFLYPIVLLYSKIFSNTDVNLWHESEERVLSISVAGSINTARSVVGKHFSIGAMLSTLRGHTDTLRLFLRMLPALSFKAPDSDNFTPLHLSCRLDYINEVDLMLQPDCGVDLSIVSKFGHTAFDEAIESYHVDVVLRLCGVTMKPSSTYWETGKEGSDSKFHNQYISTFTVPSVSNPIFSVFPPKFFAVTMITNPTPPTSPTIRSVVICAARGWFAVLHVLLHAGADPNSVDFKMSALMHACVHGNRFCALLLLNADCNVNYATYEGYTALMYAAGKGDWSLVQILLNYGAESNLRDAYGRTALMWAMEGSSPSHVQIQEVLKSNKI